MVDYNNDAHKLAERQRYRLECKLRCLKSSLDRIDPSDFDDRMDEIEEVQNQLHDIGLICIRYRIAEAQTEFSINKKSCE